MKLWPSTIAGQLMGLLAIVLIVAQVVNLLLLVGEQRLVLRNTFYNQAINVVVEDITASSNMQGFELPYEFDIRSDIRGRIFFSHRNRADIPNVAEPLPQLAAKLEARLRSNGVQPHNITVSLLPDGPASKGEYRPRGDRRGPPEGRRRPPPRRDGVGPHRRPPPRGHPEGRPPPPEARGRHDFGGPPHRSENRRPPRRPNNDTEQELLISVEVGPGIWYNAMLPHYPHEDIAPRIFFATGFLLLITLLVSWFFARRISNPFSNFVIAANKLGRGETPEPLAQEGPEDIRQAAAAFNQMQDRLTRLIDSQRTMLRAVGHDLRTPLTAMRIHVESLQEDETQNALISSIDDMTALTEDILNWAKDMSGLEDLAPVNLSSFLGSIVEDYIGQGADVSFEEPAQIIAKIRRVAMKRALQNLINNGLKYGQAVKLSLEKSDDHIAIHIDDEGPGIPDAELENVLNPFVRLEASRNKGTGGTGLGLSIAKGIVQTDGGHLELHNRIPTGLRATLTIPIH